MTRLEEALRKAVRDLRAIGASFALVGGLAVSVRTEPRFTRDLDLVIGVDSDGTAEAIVKSLIGRGYRVIAQIEQDATKRLATVRLALPGQSSDGLCIDLLFASSGIEPELVECAEPLEIVNDLVVPVARLDYLLALKLLARDDRTRPQDRIDIGALLARASAADIGSTRRILRSIFERGFHRNRDLGTALTDALHEFGFGP